MAKPVASQKTATLLLPSALLEGVAWDHSRWNKMEMTWCGEIEPAAKSSSFQFLSTFNI